MKSSGWDDRRPLQRAGTKTWLFHCLLHYGPFARLAPRSARFRTSRPPLNNVIPRSNALCMCAIASPLVKFPHQPAEIVHKSNPTSLIVKSVFLYVRNRIAYDSRMRFSRARTGIKSYISSPPAEVFRRALASLRDCLTHWPAAPLKQVIGCRVRNKTARGASRPARKKRRSLRRSSASQLVAER